MVLTKESIGVQRILGYTLPPQQMSSTLTIKPQDVLPTKGTAPESIVAWRIPRNQIRSPRRVRIATIEADISTPIHFDDLNEDTQIARDAIQSDAHRVDLVFHLAEGDRNDAEGVDWNRLRRSIMQPNIRRLPDLRRHHRGWGKKGWKNRAVIARVGGYHLFYTLAKEGLSPNHYASYTVPGVHGSMYLLKVSQAVDDQGRRFYEDANPNRSELRALKGQFRALYNIIYGVVPPEESDASPEESDESPEESDESPEESDESPEESDESLEESDESLEGSDE